MGNFWEIACKICVKTWIVCGKSTKLLEIWGIPVPSRELQITVMIAEVTLGL